MKKRYDSQVKRREIQNTTYSNPHVIKLLPCSEEQKVGWVTRIFVELKHELQTPWGALRVLTGRTRQSWRNAMDGSVKVTSGFIASVSNGLSESGFIIDTDKFLRGEEGNILTTPVVETNNKQENKRTSKVNTAEVIVRCARLVREEKMTNKQLLELIDNL